MLLDLHTGLPPLICEVGEIFEFDVIHVFKKTCSAGAELGMASGAAALNVFSKAPILFFTVQ